MKGLEVLVPPSNKGGWIPTGGKLNLQARVHDAAHEHEGSGEVPF